MEDTRVYKRCTELAALEKLVWRSEEQIVDIQHDDALVLGEAPGVDFVQREHEADVEITLILVRVLNVVNNHHSSALRIPARQSRENMVSRHVAHNQTAQTSYESTHISYFK